MNVKEIKTLVGIMEDSSLTALEIEVPDLKLRLERSAGTGSVAEVLQPPVYSVPAGRTGPGAGSRSGGVCRACPACRRRAAGRGQGERFL